MSKKKTDEAKYKRYIEGQRKGLPPDPEHSEVVYAKIDRKHSIMKVADMPDPPSNQVKSICESLVRGEIDAKGFREKIEILGIYPSPPNKQWLVKVITAYFYGKNFQKLLSTIREL